MKSLALFPPRFSNFARRSCIPPPWEDVRMFLSNELVMESVVSGSFFFRLFFRILIYLLSSTLLSRFSLQTFSVSVVSIAL